MSQSFTSWWIDNYIGWGEFLSPPTGPMPANLMEKENAQSYGEGSSNAQVPNEIGETS